jgi:hypothetical protein
MPANDVSDLTLPSGYVGGWRNNPNYHLIIYNHAPTEELNRNPQNRVVRAFLPEQFHFRIQNDWEPFLATSGSSAIEAINRAGAVVGAQVNFKVLSALVWRKTEPLTFQFTLQFDAIKNANIDVKEPVLRLIQMASPKRGLNAVTRNMLFSPGPTIWTPENRISLRVGRYFYIDSVVIQSIDTTFYTASDKEGDFIAADVDITFESWYTPDADDIATYFSALQTKNIPLDGGGVIWQPGTVDKLLASGIAAEGLLETALGRILSGAAGGLVGGLIGGLAGPLGRIAGRFIP